MLEAYLKSIIECYSPLMLLPARQGQSPAQPFSHQGRCQSDEASASNKYFIFILVP